MIGCNLATIFTLSLVAKSLALPQHGSDGDWKKRIKNVVVLVEENRSFDQLCGDFSYDRHIEGLRNTKFCNPANTSDPHGPTLCARPSEPNVAKDDPNHSISGGYMQFFGKFHVDENLVARGKEKQLMNGFVTMQEISFKTNNITRVSEVINYVDEKEVPILRTLAENFVLFDENYCDVPGPTNPNRAYITSGTSQGHGKNDNDFSIGVIPQKSIFQVLTDHHISWKNYYNSSFLPDARFYQSINNSTQVNNVVPLENFYADAAAGKLPAFSYINPECCSHQSFHPASPIVEGEAFVKAIYEALRSSKQWDDLVFVLMFDEGGGFADHMPPPINVPRPDDRSYTEKAQDGKNVTFLFNRLGERVPMILISPWVEKGVVEHKGGNHGGQYSHSSLIHTLSKLWDLPELTPRVSWASTWEHLITNDFRKNTPAKLPKPVSF